MKLNSNVVEFKGNNNEVVKGNLKYKENTPTKFEEKETSTVKENKVDTPKGDNKEAKKEVINKKEELPKTSTSMLSTVGLLSIFGLRKNRKKDK